jgi:hypothetical protein
MAIWACWASRAGDGGWSGSREGQRRPVALRPPVDGGVVGNRGDLLPAVATLSRAACKGNWPPAASPKAAAWSPQAGRPNATRQPGTPRSAQDPGQCLIWSLPRELPRGLHADPGARPSGIVRSRVWAWLRNC